MRNNLVAKTIEVQTLTRQEEGWEEWMRIGEENVLCCLEDRKRVSCSSRLLAYILPLFLLFNLLAEVFSLSLSLTFNSIKLILVNQASFSSLISWSSIKTTNRFLPSLLTNLPPQFSFWYFFILPQTFSFLLYFSSPSLLLPLLPSENNNIISNTKK